MQSKPIIERIDDNINFDWGYAGMTGSSAHHSGARWTGLIKSPLDDTFTFYTSLAGYDKALVSIADTVVVTHDNLRGSTPQGKGRLVCMLTWVSRGLYFASSFPHAYKTHTHTQLPERSNYWQEGYMKLLSS